jgi:hypothetical protein
MQLTIKFSGGRIQIGSGGAEKAKNQPGKQPPQAHTFFGGALTIRRSPAKKLELPTTRTEEERKPRTPFLAPPRDRVQPSSPLGSRLKADRADTKEENKANGKKFDGKLYLPEVEEQVSAAQTTELLETHRRLQTEVEIGRQQGRTDPSFTKTLWALGAVERMLQAQK